MLWYEVAHTRILYERGEGSGMSRRAWGNGARNGRGEERRDQEDRAELGVRDLRENCYVTVPLNTRCGSPERILFHP